MTATIKPLFSAHAATGTGAIRVATDRAGRIIISAEESTVIEPDTAGALGRCLTRLGGMSPNDRARAARMNNKGR